MKTKRQPGFYRIMAVSIFSVIVGCAEQAALIGADQLTAHSQPSPVVSESQSAEDILMRMAQFLANTQRFSVNISDNYDVLQESGQMIEFSENRVLAVNRPNGLHVEVEQSDGERHLILYDGKEITAFSPSLNVYSQAEKTGGIDEAVKYFLRDLHMRLPLAALLLNRFPEEIEKRTMTVEYVEQTKIHGVIAHHLAGSTNTVDYQVWIADGSQPLPLRIVLTYKYANGMPAFRAQFSDWDLNPAFDERQFSFVPPKGAKKIAFLAELPHVVFEEPASAEQTGGQK